MNDSIDQLAREALFDQKHEIERLSGELLADRSILLSFMEGATTSSPNLVSTAFNRADALIEQYTTVASDKERVGRINQARMIANEMRAKIFPNGEC